MEVTKEILEIIEKIIALHIPKYKVPGYDQDDLHQEAFIMSLECLKSWNEEIGPFENYLSRHLFFRLKTFVRDNTMGGSIYQENKKRLMCPLDISLVNAEDENALVDSDNVIDNVEREEILRKIDQYLQLFFVEII